MIVVPDTEPPADSLWWPANAIPPECGHQCGVALHPYAFISIWNLLWIPNIKHTDKNTGLPTEHTLVHIIELWYFMTQSGCLSGTPLGFSLNPNTNSLMNQHCDPKLANSIYKAWKFGAPYMYEQGALHPGTVRLLPEVATTIRHL
jgi:hypothetical protein